MGLPVSATSNKPQSAGRPADSVGQPGTPRDAGWLMFGHDEFRTGQNENALWGGTHPKHFDLELVNVHEKFGLIGSSPLIGANNTLYVNAGGKFKEGEHIIGVQSKCDELMEQNQRFRAAQRASSSNARHTPVRVSQFHTNYTSSIIAIAPARDVRDFRVLWAVDISILGNYTVEATGAITGDGILIQPVPGYLLFIDVSETGQVQGCIPFNSSRSSPVISSENAAFLGTNDGWIYKITPLTANPVAFSQYVGDVSAISSSPALYEGDVNSVFFGSFDKNLYAYKMNGGGQENIFQPSDKIQSTPSIDSNGALFVCSEVGTLYKLTTGLTYPPDCSATRGCALPLNQSVVNTASIDSVGVGLVVATMNGTVFYIHRGSSLSSAPSIGWRYPRVGAYEPLIPGASNAFFATPSLDAYRNIYLVTLGGDIVVLNDKGRLVFRKNAGGGVSRPLSQSVTATIALGSNESFVCTGDGSVYALRAASRGGSSPLASWKIGVLVGVAAFIGICALIVGVLLMACYVRNYQRNATIHRLEGLLYRNQAGGWVGYSAINDPAEEFIGIDSHQTANKSAFDLPSADLPELKGLGDASTLAHRWPVIARAKEEKWYIDATEVELIDLIGSGGGGVVYRAMWRGVEVAMKTMKTYVPTTATTTAGAASMMGGTQEDVEGFILELRLLSRLRHPNIVQFLGGTVAPASVGFGIITEYCERGSLWDVLKDERTTLTWSIAIKILRGVSSALQYLHHYDPPILHRDLKSPNILITSDYGVRLTDFGVSRFMPKFETKMTYLVGSPYWMAPEMFEESPYTEKADIYGFGIIMWEVLTRDEPFKTVSIFKLYALVSDGLRPGIPEWCPSWWASMMKSCWEKIPEERPSISSILSQLNGVKSGQYPRVAYPSVGKTPK